MLVTPCFPANPPLVPSSPNLGARSRSVSISVFLLLLLIHHFHSRTPPSFVLSASGHAVLLWSPSLSSNLWGTSRLSCLPCRLPNTETMQDHTRPPATVTLSPLLTPKLLQVHLQFHCLLIKVSPIGPEPMLLALITFPITWLHSFYNLKAQKAVGCGI